MADEQETELDKQIAAMSNDFVSRLNAMSAMPSLRSGLLGAALSDLFWTIYHDMPDMRDDLARELEGWPEVIKNEASRNRNGPTESVDNG